jgi:hypothetical protein
MTAPPRIWVCVALATGLAFLLVPAFDTPAHAEQGRVLERFEVAKDGDHLLLPVRFGRKTYQFVLDSGSSLNAFDTSLPLGNPIDETEARGPDGSVRLKLYEAPEARIGGLDLKTPEPVVAFDFAKLRQVSGYEIHGMIGMPFFRQNVVRIDFDKGELLVLKEPGRDCGRGFAVTYDRGIRLPLSIDVAGDNKQEFIIDTGLSGSGCLAERLFEATLKGGGLAVAGTSLHETISGTRTHRIGRLKRLSLDEFTLPGVLLGEANANFLGLGFCSRFVITFDIQHDKVYLKRGKNFDRRDTHDLSGLHVLRQDGNVVIHSVDQDSAAEAAGLKAGDVLVKVGDAPVDKGSLFRLRQCFCAEGARLHLAVRRDEKETEITLALGSGRGGAR